MVSTCSNMKHQGVFITLEGIDFSGKSTQAERLVSRLEQEGYKPLFFREPGGTALSERVREILLNRGEIEIGARAELLLFLAARTQIVDEVILPALQSGRIVVCDRFSDSTFAYQGYARGLPLDTITELNAFTTSGLEPDLTLLYDLPVEIAQKRGNKVLSQHDRLENEDIDFHHRVREGYLELARNHPGRIVVVDAEGNPELVWRHTWNHVNKYLEMHLIEPAE